VIFYANYFEMAKVEKFLKAFLIFFLSKNSFILTMHILQPKHTILDSSDAEKLMQEHNISLAQLPKISKKDPALPEGSDTGDVVKIERTGDLAEVYYRVVI